MRDFDDLVGDYERWFASGPRHLVGDGKPRRFVPAYVVLERDDETVLRFDIPGIDPEHDLEVTVETDTLRVGRRRGQSEEASGQTRYGESTSERCLTLPEGIEHDRVRAHYDRGVLQVTAALEAKKMPVSYAASGSGASVTTAAA